MSLTKITTIGGGKGQSDLLRAIKNIPDLDIKSVVSMSDSGGSSGLLRDELGVLPPGDVLKCILALAEKSEIVTDIFQERFEEEKLRGHNAGNLILAALAGRSDNFATSVKAFSKILKTRGEVIPVTLDRSTLIAKLADGAKLHGEAVIDVVIGARRERIKKVYLESEEVYKEVNANPEASNAILEADYVILGPGDLYTSVIPNLLASGITRALKKTNAKLVYVVNAVTKLGETDDFDLSDFITTLESYTVRAIDIVLVNDNIKELESLNDREINPVILNQDNLSDKRIIFTDLADLKNPSKHQSKKLGQAINKIISK